MSKLLRNCKTIFITWRINKDSNIIYIGEWQNGAINGFGVSVSKEGVVYEGYWRDYSKHGYGVEVYHSSLT